MSERSERLAAIRAARLPVRVVLNDGTTVLVRRVRLKDLVIEGAIPLTLVDEMAAQKGARKKGSNLEEMKKLMPLLDAVALAAVVDPPIAREADEDHLGLGELSPDEKMLIFDEVNRAAEELRPFRGQPAGDADPARDGDDVPPEAVGDAGD